MKYTIIYLALLLCGCSDLSKEEQDLVGYWEWNLETDGFSESGFIDLRPDRTFAYRIKSTNPTESLIDSKPDYKPSLWRVNQNSICTATHWSEGNLFTKPTVHEENCFWSVIKSESGEIRLTIDGGFIQQEIKLQKK
ncbi:hypothetical protein [Thalassotalea sp. PS06]|uniref:hypothetical protein n=1 Tax=Thalassotalea sp. PS06 TaxID=2594005 RepID=UPI0011638379|nr:hypothetical protein [Thalassotalea sp. PS06]QDP01415.1 hypothetical protein FNC98_08790 [Thalassotalea sp. PS06]